MPPLAARARSRRNRDSAGSTGSRSAGDAADAGEVAESARRKLHRNLSATKAGEQTLHHATIDGAENRMFKNQLTEWAMFTHDPSRRVVILGVGGESVRGERVGDGRHGGAHRALRISGSHLRCELASVLFANLLCQSVRRHRAEGVEGSNEQVDDEIIRTRRNRERRLARRRSIALGGAARAWRRVVKGHF